MFIFKLYYIIIAYTKQEFRAKTKYILQVVKKRN